MNLLVAISSRGSQKRGKPLGNESAKDKKIPAAMRISGKIFFMTYLLYGFALFELVATVTVQRMSFP